MTVLALIGLSFVAYCQYHVFISWGQRTPFNRAIWFLILVLIAAPCVAILLS